MASLRATLAAVRNLAGFVGVEMLDVGPLPLKEYDDEKVNRINQCNPSLAIEIHCNGGPPDRKYSEVIHHRNSAEGARAAEAIAGSIAKDFADKHGKSWPSRGARVNTVREDKHLMFFLERVKVPSVIVEGLFISNQEQAAWLSGDGGCEKYGLAVADGVRLWLAGSNA